jgi:hypothetical protein
MRFQRFTSLLTALWVIWLSAQLHAQTYVSVGLNQPPLLTADAGADALICEGDSITIGGQPTANGGAGTGYNYVWTSSLSGVTGANPTIFPGDTTQLLLTVTDSNGCSAMDSVTINVELCIGTNPRQRVRLAVYPNPTSGLFRVEITSANPLEAMGLTVIDPVGKIVMQGMMPANNGNYRRDIDLGNMSRGVYFVRLQAGDQQFSQKLILR